jgi:FAD/FMN-containing dehydrogenase
MSQSQTHQLNTPSADLLARLALIVGTEHAVLDPAAQQPYLKEWRDLYIGRTPLILRPGSTEEVSQVLALANEARVAIVPQGGNTGLVGGQIPSETGSEIVLSLNRMTRIRSVDAAGMSLTVEAGATLADVQSAAKDAGRLFPLSMASEGSCTIGGNLATNAGGVAVRS